MSEATLSDLELWVSQMMKTLDVSNYKLDISGNTTKGDGYLGEVTFITVSTPNKDYDVVVKSAKKSDELRNKTPIKEAYDREIFFYTKVFPLFEEFQKLKAIEHCFDNIPKCYIVSTEDKKEALLLQNLKSQGFELHDRKQTMNLNHIKMVVAEYARFHALSLAMKHQKPAVFRSLTKNMTDLIEKFFVQGEMSASFIKNFQYAKGLLDKNYPNIAKKYDGFEKEINKVFSNLCDENDPTSVILHGDSWNNNFMFKYEDNDNTKPVKMNFLDFQMARLASPVIDLSYFLYSCAGKQSLKDFDFILQAYHSSLSDFLSELGSDPEEIYSFNTLQKQWKVYGKFGICMALFILKITLCDATEAPDFGESVENGGLGDVMNFAFKDQDIYDERITDILVHFGEKFM